MWARVQKANSAEKESSVRESEKPERTSLRTENEIEERAVIGINKKIDETSVLFFFLTWAETVVRYAPIVLRKVL